MALADLIYYSMPQVMLLAGAFLLLTLPVTELAIGMDVTMTVALIASEWGGCAAIALAAIWLWRRSRRHSDDA